VQRRRWRNGTVGAYLVVLFLLPALWRRCGKQPKNGAAPVPRVSRLFVAVIGVNVILQLLEYLLVTLSPAVFAAALSSAIDYLAGYIGLTLAPLPFWTPGGFYLVVHAWFVLDQHSTEHVKVRMLSATLMVACDVLLMITICVALALSAWADGFDLQTLLTLIGPFGAVVFGLLMSPTTLFDMVLYAAPAVLLLATYNATFQSYAVARLWDLRWGTRENKENKETNETDRKRVAHLKAQVLDFNFVVLLVRLVVFAVVIGSRNSFTRNTAIAVATRAPSLLLFPPALVFILHHWIRRACSRDAPASESPPASPDGADANSSFRCPSGSPVRTSPAIDNTITPTAPLYPSLSPENGVGTPYAAIARWPRLRSSPGDPSL